MFEKTYFKYKPTTACGIFVPLAKGMSVCLSAKNIFFTEASVDKMPTGTMPAGEISRFVQKIYHCFAFFFKISVFNYKNNSNIG